MLSFYHERLDISFLDSCINHVPKNPAQDNDLMK